MSIPDHTIYCVRCKAPIDPVNPYCPKCGQGQVAAPGMQAQLYAPPPVIAPPYSQEPAPPPMPPQAPPPVYMPPPQYHQRSVEHHHYNRGGNPVGGILSGLGWLISTSAALVNIIWGAICLIAGFFMTFAFGIIGFFITLVVWFIVSGVLKVIRDASRPGR